MTRNSTTKRLENHDPREDFLLAGSAAFVRIVWQRRGISETEASQIYLDYINRARPG